MGLSPETASWYLSHKARSVQRRWQRGPVFGSRLAKALCSTDLSGSLVQWSSLVWERTLARCCTQDHHYLSRGSGSTNGSFNSSRLQLQVRQIQYTYTVHGDACESYSAPHPVPAPSPSHLISAKVRGMIRGCMYSWMRLTQDFLHPVSWAPALIKELLLYV